MAGLVIIPAISHLLDSSYSSSLFAPLPKNITDRGKSFLKKAFLLAKQHGKELMNVAAQREACQRDALFAAISFLGGTFGFGDEKIFDPVQGGLAGLVKTAALEWEGVVCRAIDMNPCAQHLADNIRQAVSLILAKNFTNLYKEESLNPSANPSSDHYANSTLHNGVEIGIKDEFCIFPELIQQDISSSFSAAAAASHAFSLPIPNGKSRKRRLPSINNSFINHDDVVVITGGARGVTFECALELALHSSPAIIVMGRSQLPEPEPLWMKNLVSESDMKKAILANMFQDHPPTPMELQKICRQMEANREITRNLEKIGSSGSTVQYYCVDIRDMEGVTQTFQKVRKAFGKISCIVHGAGILEDKRIIDKTEAQFSSVFDTKVNGMENLLSATLQDHLKCVIFFSSVAARTGNAGQVDYAMANEVLNKTAQYYSQSRENHETGNREDLNQCRFLSINWGPWEGGMVSPSLKNAFIKRGIELIPLKSGALSFVEELLSVSSSDVEVVIGASLMRSVHTDQEKSALQKSEMRKSVGKREEVESSKRISRPAPALFSREKILAFAIGNPSEAFGDRYREFDTEREIARLPGPPYFFMDRVIKADAKPWEMAAGGWIESQFDMPCDGWYFRAAHTDYLPFSILLEIALQPCGWLAAYAGSALKSRERLFFRNLGGEAQIFQPLQRERQEADEPGFITLTMRSRMPSVSHAGGIIIQNFDMEVLRGDQNIYKGKTNFGFFTGQSFSNQTGIRSSDLHYIPSDSKIDSPNIMTEDEELPMGYPFTLQDHRPLTPDDINEECQNNLTDGMPSKALRMVDTIDLLLPAGGKYGKGFIKGSKSVNPDEWFFKAHFYQDPVCPGSLGIESFLQIIKFYALKIWKYDTSTHELVMAPHNHKWIYRGQITPLSRKIEVCAHIRQIDECCNEADEHQHNKITADGLLYVDGLCIYQMEKFSMRLVRK